MHKRIVCQTRVISTVLHALFFRHRLHHLFGNAYFGPSAHRFVAERLGLGFLSHRKTLPCGRNRAGRRRHRVIGGVQETDQIQQICVILWGNVET